MSKLPLVGTGSLTAGQLAGKGAVVTGAGRGIGFEAARALVWLGAKTVLAEIDRATGKTAERQLADEFGPGRAHFVQTDVGDESSVERLRREAERLIGHVDIVLNNATVTPMGAIHDVPLAQWDKSYRVNLRGPVLLARAFLPGMIERNAGVFVAVASAGGAYMGAYEVLKTAQVDLARTLDMELEGTGVIAFTIGPGLVMTPGFEAAVPKLAALYGKTVDEFRAMSKAHEISAEAAGAGFAAAVALAEQFRGAEIGSRQALIAAAITEAQADAEGAGLTAEQRAEALRLVREVRQTLAEQSAGWAERPLFERQWVRRDFRRYAGQTAEDWLRDLAQLEQDLATDNGYGQRRGTPVQQLALYYKHMQDVLAGWEKDPAKREAHMQALKSWEASAAHLAEIVEPG